MRAPRVVHPPPRCNAGIPVHGGARAYDIIGRKYLCLVALDSTIKLSDTNEIIGEDAYNWDRRADRYRSNEIFFFFLPEKKRNPSPLLDTIFIIYVSNDSIDPPRRFPSVSFPFPDQMTEIVIYFPFSFFFSFNNKIEARKIHHLERAIIVDKRVCRRPAPHSKNNYFNCDFPFPPPSLLFPPSFRRCQDFRNLSSMCTAH